jgi:NTE family protein
MTARVGLVLGAGGLTGEAFHAGALAAIGDVSGWDPRRASLIVGTSAGSIVGTYLRLGIQPDDLVGHLCDEPMSARATELFDRMGPEQPFEPDGPLTWPRLPAPALVADLVRGRTTFGVALASVVPTGRVPTAPWADRIRRMAGPGWVDEPLWICALRLRDRRRITFGRADAPDADVADAIAASCSIPSFFKPVEIDGDLYVDGGAHSPTNADVVRRERLDVVVVLSPMSTRRGVIRLHPDHAARWGYRLQLALEADRLRRAGMEVITLQPDAGDLAVMRGNAMDPSRIAPVVRRVRASVAAQLEAGPHGAPLRALAA